MCVRLRYPGRMKLTHRLTILAVLLPLVFAASAHAATITVQNTNDAGTGSLRAALAGANANDVIEIPPGGYLLTSGQLVANDNNLTIRNQAGQSPPTIQATGNFRVLCVNSPNEVTLDGLVIHGGHAAPGNPGDCADSQGGGIHAEAGTILNLRNSVVQHNTADPATGGGGGIFAAGDLFVSDSIIRDNATTASGVLGNNGGGGIRWTGSGFPSFTIDDSSIYGNTATVGGTGSGGGGVYSAERPTVTNVTFSGNSDLAAAGAPAGAGGGALIVQTAGGPIRHATFFGNHSDRQGGALSGATTSLENSILQGDTAPSSPECAAGAATSQGGNLSSASAQCGFGGNDSGGVDSKLGPLAVNGSNNGTLTHAILARDSPAVEFPVNCPVANDQRGISRSQFGACDSGAYEFDGNTTADVPDCSPTGVIPLALDSGPGRHRGGPLVHGERRCRDHTTTPVTADSRSRPPR